MRVNVGKIAITIMAAAAALVCHSCSNAPKSKAEQAKVPAPNAQTIKISPEILSKGICDTLRFGVMRQGEQVIKDLLLENTSETPMVLLRHVTSCGCVNIEYKRKPITPKQSSTIHFTYDSRGQAGWQMKLLEFYFADSGTPLKLYIEAEVE
jgi:hypothetical protein